MQDKAAIQIAEILFRWSAEADPLLEIPRCEVQAGERVFLRGPSGSGKSTLLNLLGGVLSPEKGQVQVLGQDLLSLSLEQRDRFRGDHMGFIFQMFNLIPYLSVLENVILPCRFSALKHQRVGTSLADLQQEAERLLRHLKLDVPSLRDRSVSELSVGQQQRVATARALMGQPEVIIADEPTSALDADTRSAFIELLFTECASSKATLLFVSHDASLASLFDRHLELHQINRAPMKQDPLSEKER